MVEVLRCTTSRAINDLTGQAEPQGEGPSSLEANLARAEAANQAVCKLHGTHPAPSEATPERWPVSHSQAHPVLMFHYRVFGGLEGSYGQ